MQKPALTTLHLARVLNSSSTSFSRRYAAGKYTEKVEAPAGNILSREGESWRRQKEKKRNGGDYIAKHVNDPKTTYSLSHSLFCNGPIQMTRLRQSIPDDEQEK